MVFLKPKYRPSTPNDIDKIISAEIPDRDEEPRLYEIVTTLMIHGPCGDQNTSSPCMFKNRCTKHFPKKYVDSTVIDHDGYPVYRRRDNGITVTKGKCIADNRYVVPYNKQLLLKYNAHINVEWCNQTRSIKYLFKYVNKGHDRVIVNFYKGQSQGNRADKFDEIKMYFDCRYLSACEATWRIYAFDIHYREPSVERLSYHLEGEQSIMYEDNDRIEDVLNKPSIHSTKFLAWMEANKIYPEARNLTYNQFPTKFTWRDDEHRWTPRKRGFSIGRVHFAPPGSGEIFYLRTLLNYVKGPTSFDDIKTVDNVKYDSFKEACLALGLLEDDTEYINAINEAGHWSSGTFMRKLFAALMVSGQLTRPEVVWNKTLETLIDDILYIQRQVLGAPPLYSISFSILIIICIL